MAFKTWFLKMSVAGSTPKERVEHSYDCVQEGGCSFMDVPVGLEANNAIRSIEQHERIVVAPDVSKL